MNNKITTVLCGLILAIFFAVEANGQTFTNQSTLYDCITIKVYYGNCSTGQVAYSYTYTAAAGQTVPIGPILCAPNLCDPMYLEFESNGDGPCCPAGFPDIYKLAFPCYGSPNSVRGYHQSCGLICDHFTLTTTGGNVVFNSN